MSYHIGYLTLAINDNLIHITSVLLESAYYELGSMFIPELNLKLEKMRWVR